MTNEAKSKAGKAHVYGTPLIALVLAVLGYLDNRDSTKDAHSKAKAADKQAEVSQANAQVFSEERLRKAYIAMQDAIKVQSQRIDDLESWVVELEEFVEDQTEEDSPRNQREREARDARLAEIRASKRARERRSRPSAEAVPDYEDVQRSLLPSFPD